MKQMILPFPEWRHHWWIGHLFEVANASSALWKSDWFYPFKDELLTRHGIPDGWDLQELVKHCYSCEGTGQWTEYGIGSRPEKCWRCNATGIYDARKVILERYLFCGLIYHVPSYYHYTTMESAPRNVIHGLVKHTPRGFWTSTFCAWALFLMFDLPRSKRFFKQVICKSGVRIPGVSWVARTAWKVRRGLEAFNRRVFRRKNDVDEIPF